MGWSEEIREKFELPVELEQLLQAAEQARERWQSIKAQLDAEGLMVDGRYEGVKRINPLVSAEARARESFVRTLKALHLPELDD